LELTKLLIAKSTLRELWEMGADSEQYLKTCYDTAKSAMPNGFAKPMSNRLTSMQVF
jgi:mRNA-degrading endonuclease HigB of HigAB toxin-antitoxin module